MNKSSRIILFLFLIIVGSSLIYAACTTPDDYMISIKDPLGQQVTSVNPYNCTDIIDYTVATSGSSCPSTSSCTIDFLLPEKCEMRGAYQASCTESSQCPGNLDLYTCEHDDCSNCCTADTSYVWYGAGGSANCCGDDADEYHTYFDSLAPDGCDDITNENCVGKNDDPSKKKCCDQDSDCVDYNGNCVNSYTLRDIDDDGVIGEFCTLSTSQWNDCDSGLNICTNICGKNWLAEGEVLSFGEYDFGSPTECCGDDSGEYVVSAGVGPSKCCNNANDCVDLSGNCQSGTAETIANGICGNARDDDCDGECDYDSTYCSKGDSGCPVGVTSISVSDSNPKKDTSITVECTSSVAGVDSVSAQIDGVGTCQWTGWNGNIVSFSCNVGLACPQARTARCFVDSSKSYVSGTDKTAQINVQCNLCSEHGNQLICEGDLDCDWCPSCSGTKYSGGSDRCVTAGECNYYCWKDSCGAVCDSTNGGCNPGICNEGTCTCDDLPCNPDTYGSSACCDDGTQLEPTLDIDNPKSGFDLGSCNGASCYNVGFPEAEVVSVYDDLCCGDDSEENYNWFKRIAEPCHDVNDSGCIGVPGDSNDKACCNDPGDCVLNSECYPSGTVAPIDLDGDGVIGEYCAREGSGKWLDCDVSQNSCISSSCGYTWLAGGEESSFGEYETGKETECCGDDSGEVSRYMQVVQYTTGTNYIDVATNLSDTACCPGPNYCVFNGTCYMDREDAIDEINQTICGGLDENDCMSEIDCGWLHETCQIKKYSMDLMGDRISIWNTTYKEKVYKDINKDGRPEVCDPGEWMDPNRNQELCEDLGGYWLGEVCCGDIEPDPDCDATFYGNVKDIDKINIENATLVFTGTSELFPGEILNYTTNTDSNGDYTMIVTGNSTYDILVTKPYYQPDSAINQFIEMNTLVEVNFTLVSSYELCSDDCTFKEDDYCHASCSGRVGCGFYSSQTKTVCSGKVKGWSVDYNETHEVICCEGVPYKKQELKVVSIKVSDNYENLVRLMRLVVLRGKPTKMVIDVFK